MTANTLPAQNPKPKRVFLIDLDSYNPEKLEGPALAEIAKNLACNLAAQDPTIDEIHIFSTKNIPETTGPLIMELVHKTNLTVACHDHEPISYVTPPPPPNISNLIKNFIVSHRSQRRTHLGQGPVEYTILNNGDTENAALMLINGKDLVDRSEVDSRDRIIDTYRHDNPTNPSLYISKEIRAMERAKFMRDALKSIKDNVPAFYYFLKRKISSLIGGEPPLPSAQPEQTAQPEPPAPTDQTEHHPPNSLHQ